MRSRPGRGRVAALAAAILGSILGLRGQSAWGQPATGGGATVVTRDGVLEFTTNPQEGTVTVRDLLNQDILSRSLVCPDPRGAALTGDEVSLLVACRGSGEVVFVNTAQFDVEARIGNIGKSPAQVRLSAEGTLAAVLDGAGAPLGSIDVKTRRLAPASPTPMPPSPPRAGRKNQLVFIGTIHGEHRTSRRFGVDVLRRLIEAIHPDYALTEIPPNRLRRAATEFGNEGRIAEPRTSRFPEYVDVLFPLLASSGIKIVGTAAWNQPMDRYRRDRLAAIENDPSRSADWAAYQASIKESQTAIERGGTVDDPRWIHTDAYDAAQRIELDVYNRRFDRELGTGGWDTINRAHFANITRFLDEHSGEGLRLLVTYGAGHKSWMLPRLRQRPDLEVLDVSKFLDEIGAERTPDHGTAGGAPVIRSAARSSDPRRSRTGPEPRPRERPHR